MTFIVSSCNKDINNTIKHFEKAAKYELNPSKIIDLEEYDILKPGLAFKIDDSYIIMDVKSDTIFSHVNFDSKRGVKGVKRGIGPGEILSTISLQLKDENLIIYNAEKKEINQVSFISDSILGLKVIDKIKFDQRLFMLNYQNTHIVATGLFEKYWLATINNDGKIVSEVNFPEFDNTKNTPQLELSLLYLSTHMTTKTDNKKIVAATQDIGAVYCFNVNNNSNLEVYKNIKYFGPEFSIQDRGGIRYSKDGLIGFCGIDSDDKYVYVLYSGRTYAEHEMKSHHCEHLLVYDWEGSPIKYYSLEIPLISMKYDKERNSIYGIAYNPEDMFVQYNL